LKSRRSVEYLVRAIKVGESWIKRLRTGLGSSKRAAGRIAKRLTSRSIPMGLAPATIQEHRVRRERPQRAQSEIG
jgi:hypothetical protein